MCNKILFLASKSSILFFYVWWDIFHRNDFVIANNKNIDEDVVGNICLAVLQYLSQEK